MEVLQDISLVRGTLLALPKNENKMKVAFKMISYYLYLVEKD